MIDFISTHAGVIGLVFFVSFFLGVVLWVLRPGARGIYDTCAHIPLKEIDHAG